MSISGRDEADTPLGTVLDALTEPLPSPSHAPLTQPGMDEAASDRVMRPRRYLLLPLKDFCQQWETLRPPMVDPDEAAYGLAILRDLERRTLPCSVIRSLPPEDFIGHPALQPNLTMALSDLIAASARNTHQASILRLLTRMLWPSPLAELGGLPDVQNPRSAKVPFSPGGVAQCRLHPPTTYLGDGPAPHIAEAVHVGNTHILMPGSTYTWIGVGRLAPTAFLPVNMMDRTIKRALLVMFPPSEVNMALLPIPSRPWDGARPRMRNILRVMEDILGRHPQSTPPSTPNDERRVNGARERWWSPSLLQKVHDLEYMFIDGQHSKGCVIPPQWWAMVFAVEPTAFITYDFATTYSGWDAQAESTWESNEANVVFGRALPEEYRLAVLANLHDSLATWAPAEGIGSWAEQAYGVIEAECHLTSPWNSQESHLSATR